MVIAAQALTTLVLVRADPELIAERVRPNPRGAKDWDRLLARISVGAPMVIWVVVALDTRFGWSPQIPLNLQVVGLTVATLGDILPNWAMVVNRFFSSVVRIQKDRGHAVVTMGSYRLVRHPGHLGWTLFTVATPIALDSLWALVPAGLTVCAIILRTALEDETLQQELDGYRDYARQVRFRLFPGLW